MLHTITIISQYVWQIAISIVVLFLAYGIKELTHFIKRLIDVDEKIVKKLNRQTEKIKALEKYLGLEFVERTTKISISELEISGESLSSTKVTMPEMKSTTTDAHYIHTKVEESKKALMDAIEQDKLTRKKAMRGHKNIGKLSGKDVFVRKNKKYK